MKPRPDHTTLIRLGDHTIRRGTLVLWSAYLAVHDLKRLGYSWWSVAALLHMAWRSTVAHVSVNLVR